MQRLTHPAFFLPVGAAILLAVVALVAIQFRQAGTAESGELTSTAFIPAGKTRAETLREVERQTGVRLSIPWLPDGMEVTGVRVNVGLEPPRIVTAEVSVAGQGKGFGMDQTDRRGVLLGGHDLPGAPAGFTFSRGDALVTTWELSSDKASWTLSDSPNYTMDDATVLRILLGLAGRAP
ncbi:MAG: hypothetical protein IT302_08280 [Dehalococcoidia bacterium]|nr:hypothetical protein [Dehalococcoidia bacterium]